MEEPPRKYFRLFPGNEVRLMSAYFVTCTGFEKDENGNVTVIHATYDRRQEAVPVSMRARLRERSTGFAQRPQRR